MNIENITLKKLNKKKLKFKEIEYVVNKYTEGIITDPDMTKFLKAITSNGMNEKETIFMTKVMINSGSILDLKQLEEIVVDKHSTGGVGDKTTLIVSPIVAACGVYVAKMSGKALGFTGGTIDKLQSIEGFNADLSKEKFIKQLKDIKLAITSQTDDIAKADKKIYALRDITDTVSSIPLIASSIMSKKIATGADAIVLDIKVGSGSLMKTEAEAKKLARLMIKIGKGFKKKIIVVLSSMDEPLGYAIGNSLEVEEAIEILNGDGDSNLILLSKTIAAYMVMLGKKISYEKAYSEVEEVLNSKVAYSKFIQFIQAQEGKLYLPKAKKTTILKSFDTGYIQSINPYLLGEYVMALGAGRIKKYDVIDYSVGIKVLKKVGDYIEKGEPILEIRSNNKTIDDITLEDIFVIDQKKVEKIKIIKGIIK